MHDHNVPGITSVQLMELLLPHLPISSTSAEFLRNLNNSENQIFQEEKESMRTRLKSVSLRGITGDSSVNRAKKNRRFSIKEQNEKKETESKEERCRERMRGI